MTGMGQHSQDKVLDAAGTPYRRARAWAWLVFWSMAGTSVLYNVYHALVIGHMPWYTGILEGLVPLLLAIGVLEIAAAWKSWEQAVAWLVTAGAMAWSAAATGSVVQPGAPGHVGWPFGILADAAALYAMRFILNGPTAEQAVARVSAKIAELTGIAEAARRDAAEARKELGAVADTHEAWRTETEQAHREAVAALEDRAAKAEARAETLARKLASATGSGKTGNGTRKPSGNAPRKPKAEAPEIPALSLDDLPADWEEFDTETKVLFLMSEKGYSGSKAGLAAGVTDARGRQIARAARDLSGTAPQDVIPAEE